MKKIIALLFIIVVTHSLGFCEDDYKSFKRVYIGISATPDLSNRYLHNGSNNPAGNPGYTQTIISDFNSKSVPEFGFNAAFKVGINLTHWLAIESGVGYSLIQYHFNDNAYTYSGTDSFKIQAREVYHYMAIPLGLRFSMGHRKVRGVIAAGVDFDFLIKQQANIKDVYANNITNTNELVQTKNFNTFNLSPYLGLGIDCHLSPAVVLRIMPVAQIQSLKNINTPISEYLYNIGINVSLLFGL
jgi:hypothetical protein